jgi:nitrogen fixation protein FixH
MKTSRNLWPIGLIVTFVIFISGTIGLVVMACNQRVDLVNANYYDQEIKYQSRIDSEARAQQLGASASISYDATLKRIVITLPKEIAQKGVSGEIELYRPSMAGLDRQVALDMKYSNVQSIDASGLKAGLWRVRATWTANNQDYFMDQKIVVGLDGKTAVVSALP